MADLGRLVVNLEANIARFTENMDRAAQVTEQTANKISGAVDFAGKALGALGIALSVDLIVSEINRSLDSLAALDDMAQKTGSSVETLSKLSKVAAFTGTDLGAVDGMLVKLSKNLNDVNEKGNKTAKALAAIGISTDDLKGKDAAQVFIDITNKLQGYEDGAGKVALVTDLMGKSAADMLPFMNDVSESINDFASESTQSAAQAAALQDQMGRLKVKYEEIRTEIVVAAVPAATDFIQALMDTKREASNLTDNTSVDTWADDVAIGLAIAADFAMRTAQSLGMVGTSLKAVAADIQVAATLQPAVMAYELSQGRNPLDNFRETLAERDKIVQAANVKLEAFLNAPLNVLENNVRGRIKSRQALSAALAAADGPMGLGASPTTTERPEVEYSSGDKPKPKKKEGWSAEDAAKRLVTSALDESFAIKNTADATEALIQAEMKRMDQQARAIAQNEASVAQIRQSLMSDVEHEQMVFDSRMEQLRIFHDSKYENELQANALMEAETARHEAAILEMGRQTAEQRMALDMQVMQQAGGVADQMYSMLKQAGLEQTAVAKAAFLVSKGLAVAQIILSTNVAAAAALAPPPLGLGPVAGIGLAGTIKALGYSSAAMTAGLAIAEASAEGGYDIPAGVNPVTQLHEKEMVLPKAQAEVIRGLAGRGGVGGGGITIHSAPVINIDSRTDQQEVRKIVAMGVAQGNADLVDKLQRAGRI